MEKNNKQHAVWSTVCYSLTYSIKNFFVRFFCMPSVPQDAQSDDS